MEVGGPARPTTPTQVLQCLIWPGWHPGIAFYQGARKCRHLKAEAIRGTLALLRTQAHLPKEVRALVEAVAPDDEDEHLERDWCDAIDGLRILYHASPTGTERERELLLSVARNKRLVAGMRRALPAEPKVAPTWMAVLLADGSVESRAVTDRFLHAYTKYPELLEALKGFRGAASGAQGDLRRAGLRSMDQGLLTADGFWEILDEASASGEPAEFVRDHLATLQPNHIAEFDQHFSTMLRRAYRQDLWGAAFLMLGGCSDDGFRDFRAELIGRGRAVFERVVKQPDCLADGLTDIEGDEMLPNVANDVYRAKMRKDLPRTADQKERPGPSGEPWDFADHSEMRRRYPRLYSRFGQAENG